MATTSHSPELFTPKLEKERLQEQLEFVNALIDKKTTWLAKAEPYVRNLLAVRHALYAMDHSEYSKDIPLEEQWYSEDPAYNAGFIHGFNEEGKGGDLTARVTRKGYHSGEEYDQNGYTNEILVAGQALGFLPENIPAESDNPDARNLKVALADIEPIQTPVRALLILTAAGKSNLIRPLQAMELIDSGKVETDTIIISSSERPVPEKEKAGVEAMTDARGVNYEAGATEFESVILAWNHFAGTSLRIEDSVPFVLEGHEDFTSGRLVTGDYAHDGKIYHVKVVSAPYEEGLLMGYDIDGNKFFKNRAGSEDNVAAALQLLPDEPGVVVQVSHDTWKESQQDMGDRFLGAEGKMVMTVGPDKIDRMSRKADGSLILNKPQEVVDEIAKTFRYVVETKIALMNKRAQLEAQLQAL